MLLLYHISSLQHIASLSRCCRLIETCMNSLIEIRYDWYDMIDHEFYFCSEYRSRRNFDCIIYGKDLWGASSLAPRGFPKRASLDAALTGEVWWRWLGLGWYLVRFGGLRSSADFGTFVLPIGPLSLRRLDGLSLRMLPWQRTVLGVPCGNLAPETRQIIARSLNDADSLCQYYYCNTRQSLESQRGWFLKGMKMLFHDFEVLSPK